MTWGTNAILRWNDDLRILTTNRKKKQFIFKAAFLNKNDKNNIQLCTYYSFYIYFLID